MTTHTSLKHLVLLVGLAGALACSKPSSERGQAAAPPSAGSPPSAKEAAPVQAPPDTPAPAPAVETRSLSALPSFAPLVESVKAAVINVEVRSQSAEPLAASGRDPFRDFFDRFFSAPGRPRQPREQIRAGLGSGFIIDPTGVALTNNHVVQGAIAIRVRLNDGRSFDAEVLGRDPLTDVAVIKLKGDEVKNLPVVKLGDSEALRVGDWVVAIGNPFGLASSVSAGILSAKDRVIGAGPYDDFLQTDAAINPGNSGGPLFDVRGEVVGINTAIIGGGSGIGFAVPSNLAKELLPQLEKKGHVTRGWLGIGAQDVDLDLARALGIPVREGAVVVDVNEGTPAQKAGLKSDDVITAIEGQPVRSSSALTRVVALKAPGTAVTVTYYRGTEKHEAKIVLGTRPDFEGVGGVGGSENSDENRQARIGLQIQEVDRAFARARNLPMEGALITDVVPASAAELAGLTPGMVVLEAGGKPIRNAADLKNVLRSAKPGSVVLLRIAVQGGRVLRALTIPK